MNRFFPCCSRSHSSRVRRMAVLFRRLTWTAAEASSCASATSPCLVSSRLALKVLAPGGIETEGRLERLTCVSDGKVLGQKMTFCTH
jgi:hypothetical protein